MAEKGPGAPATLAISVVVCLAPREVREWVLDLPVGATVADALRASMWNNGGWIADYRRLRVVAVKH